MVAWDAVGKQAVKSTSFQVYAMGDTGFVTPLPITDPFGTPLPGNILNSGTVGVFPEFKQADNPTVRITDAARNYIWTVTSIVADDSVAGYVGNKTTAAAAAVRAATASVWQSSTSYTLNQPVINPTGDLMRCTTAHTSTATYDSTKFTLNATDANGATGAALSATYLKLGHTDYTKPTAPMIELATSAGSGRIFHLLSGSGSTSEIAGIGVDNPGSQGFTFSLKSTGNIGVGVNLETTSGSDSIGILGAIFAGGKIMELRKGSQNGGVLVSLRADYGGSGTLFQWGLPGPSVAATLTVAGSTVNATAHGLVAGQRLTFSAITGTTGITNGTTYYVVAPTANAFQVAATLGGTAITFGGVNGTANYVAADNLNGYIDAADGSFVQQSGNTNPSKIRSSVVSGGTQAAHYVYSGTPGLWFPNAIASASNSFRFQQGNAAAIGSETMVTLIELKNANAIGFYGVTPVTRAAAITTPTAPSATYVQAEAQAMKTAVDAIRNALTNIGITA